MATAELESEPMAKGRDLSVRLELDVVEDARIAADFAKKSLTKYLSDILRPIVKRDVEEGYARWSQTKPAPSPKKPSR